MEELGISHTPKHKPNGLTKADKEARKSDDLLRRNFNAEEPLTKCVTDITEIKAKDGGLPPMVKKRQRYYDSLRFSA